MDERETTIERLFGDALDLPRDQRAAFLEAACKDAPEIRGAVERLLVENDRLSGLLSDSPFLGKDGTATDRAAGRTPGSLAAGTHLGRYTIVEPLGWGAMGVVYRARDERLERMVAIKLLTPGVVTGEEARRYFRREALALARLNHPQIAAVYDTGEQDGASYIVMELVEGASLASRLQAGPLPAKEATRIALQIAEALEEAHEQGVIHRDLKPANVMLGIKGNAKVLDFGLARMLAASGDGALTLAETGRLLGTPLYMSPEQAQGKSADARTDLWSLGVLYYQCLTGRLPFQGDSSAGILRAIMTIPVPALGSEIPAIVGPIVARALEKDAALRYQTAHDFAADLRRAMRDLELMASSADGTSSAAPLAAPASGLHALGLSRNALSMRSWLALALAAAVLVTAAAWVAFRIRGNHLPAATRSDSRKSLKRVLPVVTLSGEVGSPVLSPDGRQIAFFWKPETPGAPANRSRDQSDLYVQLIGSGEPLRLTRTPTGFLGNGDAQARIGFTGNIAWSPDGREIAFGRCNDNGGAVFTVPALGGAERKLTDVICPLGETGFPSWTLDGKSLVLVDRCAANQPGGIVLYSIETGLKRCLTAPPAGNESDFGPILSPDGKTIAFIQMTTAEAMDVYTIPVTGGPVTRLTHDNKGLWQAMWSSDSRTIIFLSDRNGSAALWRISAHGGVPERETIYPGIGSLSHDGTRLVYEAPLGFENSDFVWRIDLSGPGGAVIRRRQILGSTGYNGGTEPSPDNSQIVFESNRSGRVEVWKADSYGNDPVQLTASGRHAGSPRWSPDGQWIAFDSRTGGHSQIWIMDKEGRNAHAVVTGNDENVVPAWSADGKSIFFASNRTGQYQVWIHNLTTGLERQITTKAGFAAVPSFRGDALFYTKFDGAGIWTVPLTGGVESRLTVAPHLGYWGHFAVAQDGLYFLDTEAEIRPVIEYYDLKSRKITRVTTLGEGFSAVPWAANLAASRDARTLYVAQGTTRNSVMMAEFDR